jgi:hypothetical protein
VSIGRRGGGGGVAVELLAPSGELSGRAVERGEMLASGKGLIVGSDEAAVPSWLPATDVTLSRPMSRAAGSLGPNLFGGGIKGLGAAGTGSDVVDWPRASPAIAKCAASNNASTQPQAAAGFSSANIRFMRARPRTAFRALKREGPPCQLFFIDSDFAGCSVNTVKLSYFRPGASRPHSIRSGEKADLSEYHKPKPRYLFRPQSQRSAPCLGKVFLIMSQSPRWK